MTGFWDGSGISWTIQNNLHLAPESRHTMQRPLVIYICFKYLLTKLSNNIDVFVIFRWSFTLAIFETIAETTKKF